MINTVAPEELVSSGFSAFEEGRSRGLAEVGIEVALAGRVDVEEATAPDVLIRAGKNLLFVDVPFVTGGVGTCSGTAATPLPPPLPAYTDEGTASFFSRNDAHRTRRSSSWFRGTTAPQKHC